MLWLDQIRYARSIPDAKYNYGSFSLLYYSTTMYLSLLLLIDIGMFLIECCYEHSCTYIFVQTYKVLWGRMAGS